MEEEREKYQKRLNLLGVVGMPFYAAFGLGAAAHFKGNALFSLLENPETAFIVFVVGAIGSGLDVALAIYTTSRIKALERAFT